MPGYTIHLACAKEYIKKHPREIKDEKRFFDGCVAPDFTDNKNDTHHRLDTDGFTMNFKAILNDISDKINDDYWKGYFFHLVCDDYFYRVFFYKEMKRAEKNHDTFYYDYDVLDKKILKRNPIEYFPDRTKNCSNITGEPKYLEAKKVRKFINKVSKQSLKYYLNYFNK